MATAAASCVLAQAVGAAGPAPDLAVGVSAPSKTVYTPTGYLGPFSFVITVTNVGSATATAVTVIGGGGERLTLVSTSRGTCEVSREVFMTCSLGDVEAGGEVRIEVTTTFPYPGPPGGSFDATAKTTATDAVSTNDHGRDTIEFRAPFVLRPTLSLPTPQPAPAAALPAFARPSQPASTLSLSFEVIGSRTPRAGEEIVVTSSLSLTTGGTAIGSIGVGTSLFGEARNVRFAPFSSTPGACTDSIIRSTCRLDFTENTRYVEEVRFTVDTAGTYEVRFNYGIARASYPITVLPAIVRPLVLSATNVVIPIGTAAHPATSARLTLAQVSPPRCFVSGPGSARSTCTSNVRLIPSGGASVTASQIATSTGKTVARWRVVLDVDGRLVSWARLK